MKKIKKQDIFNIKTTRNQILPPTFCLVSVTHWPPFLEIFISWFTIPLSETTPITFLGNSTYIWIVLPITWPDSSLTSLPTMISSCMFQLLVPIVIPWELQLLIPNNSFIPLKNTPLSPAFSLHYITPAYKYAAISSLGSYIPV